LASSLSSFSFCRCLVCLCCSRTGEATTYIRSGIQQDVCAV
jgi:hypothetical protein